MQDCGCLEFNELRLRITNSDYRAHSAPLFTKLGILDIFQVNLFVTSGQVHNYGTRTVNSYRSHPCCTNLKQFTILYQGPKVWNSLPAPIICSPSLPSFKKKIIRVFNKIRFGLKPHTRGTNIYRFIFIRGGLYHKPGGFLRSPRQVDCLNL